MDAQRKWLDGMLADGVNEGLDPPTLFDTSKTSFERDLEHSRAVSDDTRNT